VEACWGVLEEEDVWNGWSDWNGGSVWKGKPQEAKVQSVQTHAEVEVEVEVEVVLKRNELLIVAVVKKVVHKVRLVKEF
jgi:hypothetical protein